METASARSYEFGPFQVIPDERLLLRTGKPVHLPARVFDTLLILISNAGRLVEKSALLSTVWADSFVEEGNVALAISMLRKALDDNDHEHRYIQTVAKRGYRFLHAVRESPIHGQGLSTTKSMIQSLAVLPFTLTHSCDRKDDLGLRLTNAIITKLARTGRLVPRPTASILRYGNTPPNVVLVGREQRVDAVLLGWIENFGDRIRVTAQLVRAADETLLWADVFHKSLQQIFKLENEIVESITRWTSHPDSEETKWNRPSQSDAPMSRAHGCYLEGRYFLNKRTEQGLRRSIECFEKAITEDAEYALAFAGLADSYVLLGTCGGVPSSQAHSMAKAAALKALELDDSLAESHASLAMVHFYYEWNLSEAEEQFQRAIVLNPNCASARSWYALSLGAMGRYVEAVTQVRRAQQLDPLSLQINTVAGRISYFARQYDESIGAYRKVIELDPQYARAHTRLGITYAAMGAFEKAIGQFEEAQRLSSLDSSVAGHLGHALALSGQARKACRLVEDLSRQPHRASSVALICIGLGKLGEALKWLDRARRVHCCDVVFAKTEPLLDPLRSQSRFASLLRQIRL